MTSEALYETKSPDYFGHVRGEILPLVPAYSARVLEIGCGGGATLAHLHDTGRAGWTCGMETVASAAKVAATRLDLAVHGDVEAIELPVEDGSIDLVLALDVLEHLVDPWAVVGKLQRALKRGGVLVASIPNVRHHSVLVPLLLKGEWRYQEQGPLDRTHLRFFTRRSAVELLESSGLHVDVVDSVMSSRSRLLSKLTLSLSRPLLEIQYLLRATKS